ncbi:MAG: flap endonuclease 1 [uncultured archaeon A07HR60]|nr:MAG: flap endonuclease 1 [uncultured archaeon A07HR60]
MGNADLRQLASLRDVPFASLEGGVIAVDAHNWLYKYLTTTVKWTTDAAYTTASGEEVANLIGTVQGLPKFFDNDLTPVFVFDGGVTELKTDEVQRRREQRESAEERLAEAEAAGNQIEASRLEAQTQRLTATIHETSRELFDILDVPYVEAPAEGEAQCAYMARRGDVDYAGSEDYDTLLFGAPCTLRQLTSKGNPELMTLDSTLDELELTLEQLVDVGLLCGTDFNDGLDGVGPKTALQSVQDHGDLWGVLEDRGETIPHADRIRELYFDPPVTDEYDLDLEIDPDIERAQSYVVDEWEVDPSEVTRGFDRLESALVQTGLDDWT